MFKPNKARKVVAELFKHPEFKKMDGPSRDIVAESVLLLPKTLEGFIERKVSIAKLLEAKTVFLLNNRLMLLRLKEIDSKYLHLFLGTYEPTDTVSVSVERTVQRLRGISTDIDTFLWKNDLSPSLALLCQGIPPKLIERFNRQDLYFEELMLKAPHTLIRGI